MAYFSFTSHTSGLYICSILEGNECSCEDNPSDTDCNESTNMVGWKDYYLIIFVGSTIPIEISQVLLIFYFIKNNLPKCSFVCNLWCGLSDYTYSV